MQELRRVLERPPWMVEVQEGEALILEASTLWDFPDRSLPGVALDGDFHGATPARVVWNVLRRFTVPGDVVVDPMAGSGTTLDVARSRGRRAMGVDVNPMRRDILRGDARHLPLQSGLADLCFLDSPYGDVIQYSGEEGCLGRLPAEGPDFLAHLATVAEEIHRVMRPGGTLAWVIADQYRHGHFEPVGFRLWSLLTGLFEPVDVVCVARHHGRTQNPEWEHRARTRNFFLRGFNYLLLFRKPTEADP